MADCYAKDKWRNKKRSPPLTEGSLIIVAWIESICKLGLLDRKAKKQVREMTRNVARRRAYICAQVFPEAFRDNWPSIDGSFVRRPRTAQEKWQWNTIGCYLFKK